MDSEYTNSNWRMSPIYYSIFWNPIFIKFVHIYKCIMIFKMKNNIPTHNADTLCIESEGLKASYRCRASVKSLCCKWKQCGQIWKYLMLNVVFNTFEPLFQLFWLINLRKSLCLFLHCRGIVFFHASTLNKS